MSADNDLTIAASGFDFTSPTKSALTASAGPDPTRKELIPDPAELKVLTLPDSTLTTDGCDILCADG
jgi:hypothetical protein